MSLNAQTHELVELVGPYVRGKGRDAIVKCSCGFTPEQSEYAVVMVKQHIAYMC